MRLLQLLAAGRIAKRMDTLSHNILQRVREKVYYASQASCSTMSTAELRGYVRAQAGVLVRREAGELLRADHVVPSSRKSDLIAQTIDLVVLHVTRDLVVLEPVQVRRAA